MIKRKIAMVALLGAMALAALGIQVTAWISAVNTGSSPVMLAGPLVPPIGPP